MTRWALRRGIDRFEREWNYVATAAVFGWFELAVPAAARVSVQPAAVNVYTMSPGRIGAIVAVVMGLIGAVIGGLAVAPPPVVSAPAKGDAGRSWLWCWGQWLAIGGLVVATADGGMGPTATKRRTRERFS